MTVTFPTAGWINALLQPLLAKNNEVGFAVAVASPQVANGATLFYEGQLVTHAGASS